MSAAMAPTRSLCIQAGETKLPFGNFPRLILAWLCTEAVRTQSRELVLGRSLAKFMRELGIYSSGGREQTKLRNQMLWLHRATDLQGCECGAVRELSHCRER